MMSKKIIRLVVVFGLLLSCVQVSAATGAAGAADAADAADAETESMLKEFIPKTLMENALYMQEIESELDVTKREYSNISSSISQNKKKLSELQKEIVSLQDQLNNLDFLAAETENKIMNVMKQTTKKKNDIMLLSDHIDTKNAVLEDQVELLKDYAKFLYVQGREHLDLNRMLFADSSVSEILQKKEYAEILQDYGQELAYDLKGISFELDQNKNALIIKSAKLAELKEKLTEEQKILAEQKEAKTRLLEATRGEEEVYFELLARSKSQQNATLNDVNTLRDNLAFLQDKFNEYGTDFNADNYRGLISKRSRAVFEYQRDNLSGGVIDFSWSVSPSRGISAYFLDPSYKATFGVPHYAIDIRVPQLTPVRAPEEGIVYRVKDNDMGYSYVILAHRGGFMTVYGHIYEIKAAEGDIIHRGDVLGLSGGMPGTKGAGFMTTGPHLHFEVLKNGKHQDPLDYLPLIQVPFESLPEKYAERLKGKLLKEKDAYEKALTEEELQKFVETEGAYGYENELDIDVEEYIDFE